VGKVAGRGARVSPGLLQQRAYGTQILDVLPAMSTANKVAEQAFAVGVIQRPVDER
jgi:hypothetical protein